MPFDERAARFNRQDAENAKNAKGASGSVGFRFARPSFNDV